MTKIQQNWKRPEKKSKRRLTKVIKATHATSVNYGTVTNTSSCSGATHRRRGGREKTVVYKGILSLEQEGF
jgi:hypothetical protein